MGQVFECVAQPTFGFTVGERDSTLSSPELFTTLLDTADEGALRPGVGIVDLRLRLDDVSSASLPEIQESVKRWMLWRIFMIILESPISVYKTESCARGSDCMVALTLKGCNPFLRVLCGLERSIL